MLDLEIQQPYYTKAMLYWWPKIDMAVVHMAISPLDLCSWYLASNQMNKDLNVQNISCSETYILGERRKHIYKHIITCIVAVFAPWLPLNTTGVTEDNWMGSPNCSSYRIIAAWLRAFIAKNTLIVKANKVVKYDWKVGFAQERTNIAQKARILISNGSGTIHIAAYDRFHILTSGTETIW